MKRTAALFVVSLSVVATSWTRTHGGGDYPRPRPRYTMPKPGESRGSIDWAQYVALEDPIEAGSLLLAEAQMVGLNIDDSSQVCEGESMKLLSGWIKSGSEAYEYMRRVRAGAQADSGAMGAYLVRLRRTPTLRERSAAMSVGIHISPQFLPREGMVLAMRDSQVAGVSLLPYVKWIRPYLPQFKCRPDAVFKAKPDNVHIERIPRDTSACREDLAHCGGTIQWVSNSSPSYTATVHPDSIDCVARLWWVLYIEPVAEPIND